MSGLLLASCADHKQTTVGITKEQISFPIGQRIENPAFTGEAYLKPLINVDSVFNFPQTNVVTFGPVAHSSWHRHGGMVVLVTDGVGLYQEVDKPAQILRRGDVLQIPAGVRHWHGATKDNWFSQVVIYDSAWKPTEASDDSDNSVSDEYYNGIEMVPDLAHLFFKWFCASDIHIFVKLDRITVDDLAADTLCQIKCDKTFAYRSRSGNYINCILH